MHTILRGKSKEVIIGIDRPFVMIGEKINPTGRKKLAAALLEGNFDYVRQLVENQTAWGAELLDINVGVPGLDEVAIIPKIVELVTSMTDIPVCLDFRQSGSAGGRPGSCSGKASGQFGQWRREAPGERAANRQRARRGRDRADDGR